MEVPAPPPCLLVLLMVRSGSVRKSRLRPGETTDGDEVVLSRKLAHICSYANSMMFRCCGEVLNCFISESAYSRQGGQVRLDHIVQVIS